MGHLFIQSTLFIKGQTQKNNSKKKNQNPKLSLSWSLKPRNLVIEDT